MATSALNVPNISYAHCERTITGALRPVASMQFVNVDIPARRVHVEDDPAQLSVDHMKDILEEEDYPVASVAAA